VNAQKNRASSTAVRVLALLLAALVLAAAGESVTLLKETQGREGPGSYYKLVKLIPQGTKLTVLETKRNWHKVKFDNAEVWISGNAFSGERTKRVGSDPFKSLSFDGVTAQASPATLTAAIKGFWTRYSRSLDQLYELPVDGYDIPPRAFEAFVANRAGEVGREKLFKKYKLRGKDKKHSVPLEKEHSIGYACASAVADAPLVTDEAVIRYVHNVGWYVAESTERYDIHYNFYILDTDRINAVSCPGGYIVLTKGLLKTLGDESELAALLAHEMAHVIAGHGMIEVMESEVQRKAGSAFDALNRSTTGPTEAEEDLIAVANRAVSIAQSPKLDKYEFEADEMALRYLARCGYDLGGHIRLLNKLKAEHDANIDIFDLNYRNHPDFGERMKRSEREMRDYRKYSGKTFADSFRRSLAL